METLGLVRIPDLSAAIEEKGERYGVEKEFLCGAQCPVVLIGFKDIAENVKMVFQELSPEPGAKEAGLKADILAPQEPLWMALGTGVAVGLARLQDSPILDQNSFFGLMAESKPDLVVQALRKHGLFGDVQQAIHKAFYRPSLAAFDPEALRVLQVEEQIDKVMLDMLGTIKVSKRVEPGLFSKFYLLLDEILLGKNVDGQHRKDVLGLLLLVYEYLVEEGGKIKDSKPVFVEAKCVRDRILALGFELSSFTLSKLSFLEGGVV